MERKKAKERNLQKSGPEWTEERDKTVNASMMIEFYYQMIQFLTVSPSGPSAKISPPSPGIRGQTPEAPGSSSHLAQS